MLGFFLLGSFGLFLVGDLLVELANLLQLLNHAVLSEDWVYSEAGLVLLLESSVEPGAHLLNFVCQVLALFLGDPRLRFEKGRQGVFHLLQSRDCFRELALPECVLLLAALEFGVGGLQLVGLGLVLPVARLAPPLEQPVFRLVALRHQPRHRPSGLVNLVFICVEPATEFVNEGLKSVLGLVGLELVGVAFLQGLDPLAGGFLLVLAQQPHAGQALLGQQRESVRDHFLHKLCFPLFWFLSFAVLA